MISEKKTLDTKSPPSHGNVSRSSHATAVKFVSRSLIARNLN